jgi:hypothetical protein
MDDFKSKLESIQTQIKLLQIELEAIKSICRHPIESEVIRDLNPSGGSNLQKVCGHCGKSKGFPTPDEIDKYLN